MIRFVDLKTGNVFDGKHPYIFWFDGQQSTSLIYIQKICFISHDKYATVKLPSNDVFCLLNPSEKITDHINNVDYTDLEALKTDKIILNGFPYNNYYIYMVYVMGQAEQAGEYIEKLYIDDEEYVIGADFYQEEESLYINLSNNGIEIPNSIQKTIYSVNVHEDKRDNITLNRKWKELLSNLWDITINKGSYRSLYNSLKWFEWGDQLNLYEIWKVNSPIGSRMNMQDIQMMLQSDYLEEMKNTAKTTYLAITMALCKITDSKYDSEKNPELEKISSIWSIEDLSLKLSLLGNFYKTYFMPIHLDLIMCTIEDIVYTNTFKTNISSISGRSDFYYNIHNLDCNVKPGSSYQLENVTAYVGPDTIFGTQWNGQKEYNDVEILGIQTDPVKFPLKSKAKIEHKYARTQVNSTPDPYDDSYNWTKTSQGVTRQYPYEWMTMRVFNDKTLTWSSWLTPVLINSLEINEDSIIEYLFQTTNLISPGNDWSPQIIPVSEDKPYCFVKFKTIDILKNQTYWSEPILIKQWNKWNDPLIEYQYKQTTSYATPTDFGWTDQVLSSSDSYKYVWTRFRTFDVPNFEWSNWSDPILIDQYGDWGGLFIEYEYALTTQKNSTPTQWTKQSQGVTSTYKYEWVRFRTRETDLNEWSNWSDPIIIVEWDDTKSYNSYSQESSPLIVSDDSEPNRIDDSDLKTYLSQLFNGVGAVVEFEYSFPCNNENDFIKCEQLVIYGDGKQLIRTEYRLIKSSPFKFKLLFKNVGEYEVNLTLISISGDIYNHSVKINIIDTIYNGLTIYKIKNNKYPDFSIFIKDGKFNWSNAKYNLHKYSMGRYLTGSDIDTIYKQYVPASLNNPSAMSGWNWEGICLNHLLIIDGIRINKYIEHNYFTFEIQKVSGTYTVCISKRFGFDPSESWIQDLNIYRSDYIFIPEFHSLFELGYERYMTSNMKDRLDYYTITDNDALCIVPDISYSKHIDEFEWEFVNVSTGEKVVTDRSIFEPFIAKTDKNYLTPGYYDIIFRYRLSHNNEINTVTINSAFRKV